jgi:hypothetical protein
MSRAKTTFLEKAFSKCPCSAEHTLSGDISRAIFPLFLLAEKNQVFHSFLSFNSGIALMLEVFV